MRINHKTILITGGTGYLGSNIIKKIHDKFKIICLYRDKKKLKVFSEKIRGNVLFFSYKKIKIDLLLEKYKVDIVFHCATNYGKESDDENIIESNLLLPLRFLRAAIRNKNVNFFINTDTILDKRINSYSLSKKQFRDWLLKYSSEINAINIKFEHFYGPKDDKSKFINMIVDQLKNNVEKIDLTMGFQKRDFIYIDDAVDAVEIILENLKNLNNKFDIEIGTGNLYTIRHVVEKIKSLSSNSTTKLNFGALKYRNNEIMVTKINNNLVKRLGWRPKFNLKEGLLKTIER